MMKDRNEVIKRIFNADVILLGLIVITGAILRFYDFAHLPYSFDEFSALFRTRFDNFHDLIKQGVIISDTHPAGVQVFLFFWAKLFGESEMAVKLPFMLFGLGAVILGYKTGKLWFNSTVGLFIALFLSVLQYPVTYSQYARPYSSGLFLSLLMVWFWTHLVFYPEKNKIINRFGFILSAALCAYNHHFSMLIAVLAGASGLFFLKKKEVKAYLLSCLAAIVLYLPHISILLIQINKKGVETWLSKPGPGFILEYFGYILHFSPWLYIITVVFIAAGFLFLSGKIRETNKFRLLAFLWFAITYLAGYFYSVYINALLQYSVLIFVFPFLVMLVFSHFGAISNRIKAIMVLLFIVVSVYSLVYERKHYQIMYESAYEEIPVATDKIIESNPGKTVTAVIFEPQKIREYCIKKHEIDDDSYYYPDSSLSFLEFREFISRQTSDLLVLGSISQTPLEYKLIAEEKYPFMILKKNWFKGDLYVYSGSRPEDNNYAFADTVIFRTVNTFDTLTKGWENVVLWYQLTPGVNYDEDMVLKFNREYSFSPKFAARISKITNSKYNEMFISLDTYMPSRMASPSIICEFRLGEKVVHWQSGNVGDFIDGPDKRRKAYLAVRLADLKFDDPKTEVWVYFWNKNLEEIIIDDFKIEIRQGNPIIYGLFNKI